LQIHNNAVLENDVAQFRSIPS